MRVSVSGDPSSLLVVIITKASPCWSRPDDHLSGFHLPCGPPLTLPGPTPICVCTWTTFLLISWLGDQPHQPSEASSPPLPQPWGIPAPCTRQLLISACGTSTWFCMDFKPKVSSGVPVAPPHNMQSHAEPSWGLGRGCDSDDDGDDDANCKE